MPACGAARLVVSALSLKRPQPFPPEGLVAEWLRRGLQILAPRFDSGRGLQSYSADFTALYRPAETIAADPAGQLMCSASQARNHLPRAMLSQRIFEWCPATAVERARAWSPDEPHRRNRWGSLVSRTPLRAFTCIAYVPAFSARAGAALKHVRHHAFGEGQRRHGDDHRQADNGQPEPEIQRRLFAMYHPERDARMASEFPCSGDQRHHRRFS